MTAASGGRGGAGSARRDEEQPAGIIATFRDALPPGSYLVLSHGTGDFRAEAAETAAAVYDQATSA
ncbi:MAG TPA: SAM-dependent methyltransferase, partial [Streptosporangiaceae bacterium]|nr:SAM-dependent methyltransferase [Streptosporangiaceae bacterium]